MHNLRNNTHIQEALQPHKTKTQLVAVGGCGQVSIFCLIVASNSQSAIAKYASESKASPAKIPMLLAK